MSIHNGMVVANVWLEGVTPMLQHRFIGEPQEKTGRTNRAIVTPREEAENCVYRDAKGSIVFPSSGILRALCAQGTMHKQKSSRKSVAYLIPAAVCMSTEYMDMYLPDRKARIRDYEVDSRSVVIPATKGRVLRNRPRLDQWAINFEMTINQNVLDAVFIRELLIDCGVQQGLGDYRVASKGPFGKYDVVSWEVKEMPKRIFANGNLTKVAV